MCIRDRLDRQELSGSTDSQPSWLYNMKYAMAQEEEEDDEKLHERRSRKNESSFMTLVHHSITRQDIILLQA